MKCYFTITHNILATSTMAYTGRTQYTQPSTHTLLDLFKNNLLPTDSAPNQQSCIGYDVFKIGFCQMSSLQHQLAFSGMHSSVSCVVYKLFFHIYLSVQCLVYFIHIKFNMVTTLSKTMPQSCSKIINISISLIQVINKTKLL